MVLLLTLFAVGLLGELLLHISSFLWRYRGFVAGFSLASTAVASAGLVLWAPGVFSGLVLLLSAYRILNCLRIAQGRMHPNYLRHETRRTTLVLIALQMLVALGWLAWHHWHTSGHTTWALIAGLQLLAAVGSLAFTIRNIKKTSWPKSSAHYSDAQLPSITVAIPARNETADLQQCLDSLLASNYPKLEVLVLDDCSQFRRTPEIIRSFAHAGVRFVKGEQPSDTWLPKNHAYEQLASQASGEYIVFCGVDVRFAPDSLRKLLSVLLHRKKLMLSILPARAQSAYAAVSPVQAMRYWWELVPPRRLFRRPPVLSTCWVIKRTALRHAGGFRAVARSIVPEAYFARETAKAADGYSFLRGERSLGLVSAKKAAEQRQTAVRMRYPQVHRRPEQVAIHSFLEASFLLLPFVLSLGGFWLDIGLPAQILATLACLCLVIVHELVVLSTHVNSWWFGLVAPPFMIITDIGMLHYSMYKYEFSTVDWKGRNVCIPAMHVVPHLPKV